MAVYADAEAVEFRGFPVRQVVVLELGVEILGLGRPLVCK